MSPGTSLRTAIDALSRAPVVVLGGLVYALVVLPQRALQLATVPILPGLLQIATFFVTPFVLAGVVGMAREALDGETSSGTFIAVGRRRYVDLLLGTLVELAVQLAFGVVFLVLTLVVVVTGTGGIGPATVVGAAVLAGLVLAYLAVLFAIQFYPVVIVVDDVGPVDGVTRSVAFVRDNVLATLGYTAVTVVLGTLASLPVSGFAAYRFVSQGPGAGGAGPTPFGDGMGEVGAGSTGSQPATADLIAGGTGLGLSTPEIAVLSLASVAATTLFFAFRQTYATAFYRQADRTVEERVLDSEP